MHRHPLFSRSRAVRLVEVMRDFDDEVKFSNTNAAVDDLCIKGEQGFRLASNFILES